MTSQLYNHPEGKQFELFRRAPGTWEAEEKKHPSHAFEEKKDVKRITKIPKRTLTTIRLHEFPPGSKKYHTHEKYEKLLKEDKIQQARQRQIRKLIQRRQERKRAKELEEKKSADEKKQAELLPTPAPPLRRSARLANPIQPRRRPKTRRIKPEHGIHHTFFNNFNKYIRYYLSNVQHKSKKDITLLRFLYEQFRTKHWYSLKTKKWKKY